MCAIDRVAVVVVHGIADQRAGQTVREIARLLCHGGEGEPRFLWSSPGRAYRIALVGPDGKVEADRAGDRTELCLGACAHTHYFSNDAVALAVEIDRLIKG